MYALIAPTMESLAQRPGSDPGRPSVEFYRRRDVIDLLQPWCNPTVVLELDLDLTTEQALAECRRRGLIIESERELAGRVGSKHWHLRIPGRAGTLELNEWRGRVWVKVHPLREGGWAPELARELSKLPDAR